LDGIEQALLLIVLEWLSTGLCSAFVDFDNE